uniref:Putative glutathione S-transferase omega class member 3a n=1 Tax=Leptinotarsa decemlineata TaxID=7539 RepID=A0A1P8PEV2_LEPDE|nr:putative glutathione S-transferase omega class member 3a [Leptinotarsa decemlineata]
MSEIHLSTGSQEPPRVEGLLRVYSNKFCPFAQRVLLVLKAKEIPHDIVNINIFNKPEWYFNIHLEGKVPVLLDGSNIILESLDICEYLEEKYPHQHPLYPSDPETKNKDRELIQKIEASSSLYMKCCFGKDDKTSPEEWAKLFVEALQDFEDELEKRGTRFFGGEEPGMLDYMLWPWEERSGCVSLRLGKELPLGEDDLPRLRKWKEEMKEHPLCAELFISAERFWKVGLCKLLGREPPFDEA